MFRQTAFGIALSTLVLATGLTTKTSVTSNTHTQKSSESQSLATQLPRVALSTSLEKSVFEEINRFRVSNGLPKLHLKANISRQARIHSLNIAKGKVPFSHLGFKQRVNAIPIGYLSAAENVAFNQGYSDPANQAVIGWLNSPGHLKNIEGNYNLTGIGVASNSKGEFYITQIFLRSSK
ncbi:MAG: CAP domain-containing protein [Stigonema ocellatum SAG 48.90 = DSM 106950]|nr:CAP domain-containing protein [Stigonema ocellatum SAG 48.90 = DSM 106950]